jgi:hypothetical protein
MVPEANGVCDFLGKSAALNYYFLVSGIGLKEVLAIQTIEFE